MPDIARVYETDKAEYTKIAKDWTQKYAMIKLDRFELLKYDEN